MITFVIPTINEEINIRKTLKFFIKLKKKIIFNVIIVDDKSSDNTVGVAKSFKKKLNLKVISNQMPQGLGYALLIGFKKSKKGSVIFLDADLSITKRDIVKMIKICSKNENEIVIGSRYLPRSKIVGSSRFKVFLSKYLNKIISFCFQVPVCDMSHSFRSIKRNIKIQTHNHTHPGFFWEMTINAYKNGILIKEIPIKFYDRKYGLTKNSSLRMIKSIFTSIKNLIHR